MNAERRIPIVLVVVSLALVLLVRTGSWAQGEPARLSDVTVTPHPDSVTVFVKTSREAQYKADLVDSPSRLVIDLENTVYAWRKTPLNAPPAPTNGQRLISFDFKDADVVNLLRILAAESNKNVVIGDDVKGKMSITLKNVPWDLALDTILETRGLRKVEKDGVLRIVSNEQLIKEREATARVEEARVKAESDVRTKLAEAQLKEQEAIDKKRLAEAAVAELRARGPLREETIRLSYADPEEVARTLQGILGIPPSGVQAQIAPAAEGMPPIAAPPFSALYGTAPQVPLVPPPSPTAEVLAKGITIRAYKPTNSIFIRHYEADLERIKTLIREKLDIPLPQVKIEARMEILARNDLFALGIQWGGGGAAVNNNTTLVGRGFTSSPGVVGVQNSNNQLNSGGIPPVGLGSGVANPNATLTNLLPVSAVNGLPNGGNVVNLPIGSILPGVISAGTAGDAVRAPGHRAHPH